MRTVLRTVPWLPLAMLMVACATGQPATAQVPPVAQVPPAGQSGTVGDTLDPNFVPAGFGSLKQDDIALRVSPSSGLQVRAIPLDERLIRLLSVDSYRAMRDLVASKQQAILAVKERNRLRPLIYSLH